VIPPPDANKRQDRRLERLLGHGERERLDLCQTYDDPFFRPSGSVSCSARVPAFPMAGLLLEPHLLPVQPIRQWHRRTATPSTIQAIDVGTGRRSVKKSGFTFDPSVGSQLMSRKEGIGS
jgi:hypothetical protein